MQKKADHLHVYVSLPRELHAYVCNRAKKHYGSKNAIYAGIIKKWYATEIKKDKK